MKIYLWMCVYTLLAVTSCTSLTKKNPSDLEIAMREYRDGNYPAAKRIFERYCDRNERASCSRLGALFLSEKNNDEALPYFEKSCDLGDPWGCEQLGINYLKKKNYDLAFPLFEKRCQVS